MGASVFVTVGSQKFPFDRLLRAVDRLAAGGAVEGGVLAQSGTSAYVPENYGAVPFMDRDEFARAMAACDVVMSHGGTGAIVGALKAGKRVVAVPRLARCGEHVDDHQVQIVEAFAEAGLIEPCMDADDLGEAYRACLGKDYEPYVPNNARFVADLDAWLSEAGRGRR